MNCFKCLIELLEALPNRANYLPLAYLYMQYRISNIPNVMFPSTTGT